MTPFALLRRQPLHRGLAEAFFELCTEPSIVRYLFDGHVMTMAEVLADIAASEALAASGGLGVVLLFDGEEAVGFCGLRAWPKMSVEPEVVIALRPSHTGRGLATAAVCWLVEEVRALGWSRIVSAADAPNVRSLAMLQRVGFEPVGAVPGVFGELPLFAIPLTDKAKEAFAAHRVRRRVALAVDKTWDGAPLVAEDRVAVLLDFTGDELLLTVDAPMHGDAPPPGAPGPTPGLWEHEVVEVFLLGDDDRYLEVELGPAGHHLVLSLSGRRQVVAQGFDLHFEVERGSDRWRGRVRVPLLWLPDGLNRVNATAIHGPAWRRSYSASFAGTGPRPDFHRLEDFGPLP